MRNNYDPIARYYDVLSRLVFFRAQLRAQTDQLPLIPAGSKILIVGGGTGWILEKIAALHPSGLEITYVEISGKMLELSRKRDIKGNTLHYIHASAEEAVLEDTYDVILTAFLFDNFSAERIELVFARLHQVLKKGGLWLFSDFYLAEGAGRGWQWYLLRAMYAFFKRISDVEAQELISTQRCFERHQYHPLKAEFYYGDFIKSIVYQKS